MVVEEKIMGWNGENIDKKQKTETIDEKKLKKTNITKHLFIYFFYLYKTLGKK